jgi:hypothetical protein
MTDPSSFLHLEYLDHAIQFHDAFHELRERHPTASWPRYFLLCHSVELALKAFLLQRGATPERVREIELRHNFKNLLAEAVQKGLVLTPETQTAISTLAEAHSQYWHRYPKDEGLKEFFTIEQFAPTAHELLNAVSLEVRGRRWATNNPFDIRRPDGSGWNGMGS